MAACSQLGYNVTGNCAIGHADPENPTLEPNMKCIGSPLAETWPLVYLKGTWNPILGEKEVAGVSDGTIRKSDGGFLKVLHCDRCASVTIRPQFALECLGP